MNDIVIPEITISLRDLMNAILLYLACLSVVMVISKYRRWLKKSLWRIGTVYWILTVISVAVFLPAIWNTVKLVTGNDDVLGAGSLRYVVLLAAIAGPIFIVWRMYIAHYQTNTAEADSIIERIAKAVEQLEIEETVSQGTKTAPEPDFKVRLGAIYSLERIAQESLDNHVQIMETLCVYIQNNSKADTAILPPENSKVSFATWRESIPPVRIDIQAAIDVIARRNEAQLLIEITEKYTLDLRTCNLQRVNLRQGKFDLAVMEECHLDFAQMKNAELNGVVLNRATLNGAKLEGARLNGAELNGAKLNMANFDQAELNGAKCNGAELNRAELNGSALNRSMLNGAELNGVKIGGADFSAAQTKLTAIKSTDLSAALRLSEGQVNSMFGDASTTLPAKMKRPDAWPEDDLDYSEFYTHWQAAKKKPVYPKAKPLHNPPR